MRNHKDWIISYLDYSKFSEAPRHMHFWAGVSAIAGALRRKVWIDQAYFKWFPNFYIIIVAPPGIVAKSTTSGIAMNLLKRVPGINFGPDVVTWPALVGCFSEATEGFDIDGMVNVMSAITLESSEFGNLLDPSDKDMVDLLVSLWDGKPGVFKKRTKNSGNDDIENPWINLIACTTPSWIAGNFPEYMIGGGFTSRCLFVYAEEKAKLVAYPYLEVPENLQKVEDSLVEDLTAISCLKGAYQLSPAAISWGKDWYEKHFSQKPANLDDDRFGGYLARKQTHIHKLAMVLAASSSDQMVITDELLSLSNTMVTDLEPDMSMVFAKIGKTDASFYADRLVQYVAKRGRAPYTEVYRYVHSQFPSARDFEDVIAGCVKAGLLAITHHGSIVMLEYRGA